MAIAKRLFQNDSAAAPDELRQRMVERQLAGRGIEDGRVLQSMREVPREAFVPASLVEFAYDDTPLPIGGNQTISQPFVVALMLEAVELQAGDRVLDIGTGSGYAAAVASRIGKEVISVERHALLAETARKTIQELGYRNIEIHVGDGSRGWSQRAPFDAILVAAGSPEVPQELLDQLAPGGRLVIPVGSAQRHQHLLRMRKSVNGELVREDLGAVAFVPLIGEKGWHDPKAERKASEAQSVATGRVAPTGEVDDPVDPIRVVARYAEPLRPIDDPSFAELFDRIADANVVLLGEATHGTSEFYRARAAITRRLVEYHGFTILAIEADWPDAAAVDRYIRRLDGRRSPDEQPFARFPTWMWRNVEMRELFVWLHGHNSRIEDPARQVSLHGLDLYSLNASIKAVLDYLERIDPEAAEVARERYGCLSPWQRDPATYGRAALSHGFASCEEEVVAMLREMLDKRLYYASRDGESYVDAEQNARLIAAAERYYRAIYYGAASSWNLRDQHMFETLKAMMEARNAKAVVWAHNSHIGNAVATEMGSTRGELNIGQLCREEFGRQAALVGFGTDRGTVAAASTWNGSMEIKRVRPALDGSCEALCRNAMTESADFLLDLRPWVHEELRGALLTSRPQRAIGVIYRPESEYASHYFETSLPDQFDLYLWFEETSAVQPLAAEHLGEALDTYPFGL